MVVRRGHRILSRTRKYLQILQEKIASAEFFLDDVPFTEISAGCLDTYKSQYQNVYLKGALIGMCVDVLIREHSKGEMGLQDLMRKLENVYGPERPFHDEELFDQIVALSFPELSNFFRDHVEGPSPLPLKGIFSKVGIQYEQNVNRRILTMGRVGWGPNADSNRYEVRLTSKMNRFGRDMGFEKGDVFQEFAEQSVDLENFDQVINDFRANFEEGDKVVALVLRPDGKGGFKKKKLKAKAYSVKQVERHLLSLDQDATPEQVQLRNAWLNN